MSDYSQALAFLYSLTPRGMHFELTRMRKAAELLGNPQRSLRCVHIAGTNGKGSVAAMLEHALRAQGLTTGLYTSPHLHSFRERIQIDRVPIAEHDVVQGVDEIQRMLAQADAPRLTFFEVTTLLAWLHFARSGVEVVILEVGLGGRLDATNIIEAPLLSIITSIALDHVQYLGPDFATIAAEKAGIIKEGIPVVVGAVPEEAEQEIARIAASRQSSVSWVTRAAFSAVNKRIQHDATKLATLVPAIDDGSNTRTALLALAHLFPRLGIEPTKLHLEQTVWPGRQEYIASTQELPHLLFDAAHNVEGCRRLRARMRELSVERVILVFAVMADKAWQEMLCELLSEADTLVCTTVALGRALAPEEIKQFATGKVSTVALAPTPSAAVQEALNLVSTPPNTALVVCGSIYFMADARAELRQRYREQVGMDFDPHALPQEPPVPL